MTVTRFFAAPLAMAAALVMPATAAAQAKDCVNRAEARAVTANLLPDLLVSAGDRCGRLIGRSSYLATGSADQASRLQPAAAASWPTAKRALERVGSKPLPDDPQLLGFGRRLLAESITADLDANSCRLVDALTRELAPLPPENFVNVFALFLEAGIQGNAKSPVKVCEAPRG